MVHKIIREQFFKDVESPLALNLFSVATHYLLRFIRD